MAFMGRGDFSSVGNRNFGGIRDNSSNDNHYDHYHRGPYFYRRFYYYIPLDNTYVIMQMIVTFIILIVGIITFIATYKSSIIDPIESIKSSFLNTHLIVIAVFLVISFLINYSSKDEFTLITRLIIVLLISMITMLVFFGNKLNLDSTYNRASFEKFYEEQHIDDIPSKKSKKETIKSKFDIGITGLSMKTEKEYYIDECMKLYEIFKIKSYGTLGLHLLLNILFIFQISKIVKTQGKMAQMNKDDAILFDEEQNVRF